MGILNKLFGKNKNGKPILKIGLNDSGIYINGNEISFPTSISKLSEILGEPTRKYYEDNDWRIIWDNLGICTDGSLSNILSLQLIIKQENRIKHLPESIFQGIVLINEQSIENSQEKTIKVKKYQIGKLRFKGDENNDIYCYSLGRNYEYKEQKNKEKYTFQKISGEKIEFFDFNFKLAIIEELMYGKELLQPKFDVFEFAELYDKRIIDTDGEGYEPIAEVVEYFKNLEIDKRLAEQVTEIYQDGGNEIYMNIIPYWDGEDDSFNIQSYEDIKYFPNLKKMTLFNLDTKILDELKAKGIEAKPL